MTTMATDEKDAPKAKCSETWYSMDEAKIEEVRKAKAWMQDANYFTRVMVSPAASMKMLMHAHSGCEAGMAARRPAPVFARARASVRARPAEGLVVVVFSAGRPPMTLF